MSATPGRSVEDTEDVQTPSSTKSPPSTGGATGATVGSASPELLAMMERLGRGVPRNPSGSPIAESPYKRGRGMNRSLGRGLLLRSLSPRISAVGGSPSLVRARSGKFACLLCCIVSVV